MPSIKKALKEEYDRLKKAFDKMINPQKEKTLVLQPVRVRKNN